MEHDDDRQDRQQRSNIEAGGLSDNMVCRFGIDLFGGRLNVTLLVRCQGKGLLGAHARSPARTSLTRRKNCSVSRISGPRGWGRLSGISLTIRPGRADITI